MTLPYAIGLKQIAAFNRDTLPQIIGSFGAFIRAADDIFKATETSEPLKKHLITIALNLAENAIITSQPDTDPSGRLCDLLRWVQYKTLPNSPERTKLIDVNLSLATCGRKQVLCTDDRRRGLPTDYWDVQGSLTRSARFVAGASLEEQERVYGLMSDIIKIRFLDKSHPDYNPEHAGMLIQAIHVEWFDYKPHSSINFEIGSLFLEAIAGCLDETSPHYNPVNAQGFISDVNFFDELKSVRTLMRGSRFNATDRRGRVTGNGNPPKPNPMG